MKLTGFELLEVRLPLRTSFASSGGERRERRVILLRVESRDGAEGWSECVAGEDPSYTSETAETAWHVLTEFVIPGLIGREVLGPEDLTDSMAWIRGHPMARATAEMAGWDLQAKEVGVPLWELLGGTGEPVAAGVSLGLQPDVGVLLEQVAHYVDAGYGRVKLKIAPGRDLEPVRAVREEFPDLPLMVDANGAYDLSDLPVLRALDELGLQLVEQPFHPDDLSAHARLREEIEAPVCLDESIRGGGHAATALALGACDAVSVKPSRVGGHAAARRIMALCEEAGVDPWVGGMLETGIGRAHALALATLPGFTLTPDLSASARYWERDIATPAFELEHGCLTPTPEPGIGVQPDRAWIRDLSVRSQAFGTLVRPVHSG